MTTPNEQDRADSYTEWCEENDRDPYDPETARDYDKVLAQADREYQEYLDGKH